MEKKPRNLKINHGITNTVIAKGRSWKQILTCIISSIRWRTVSSDLKIWQWRLSQDLRPARRGIEETMTRSALTRDTWPLPWSVQNIAILNERHSAERNAMLPCSHVIIVSSALTFCSKRKLQYLMEAGNFTGSDLEILNDDTKDMFLWETLRLDCIWPTVNVRIWKW
jgi:hypothetical protein